MQLSSEVVRDAAHPRRDVTVRALIAGQLAGLIFLGLLVLVEVAFYDRALLGRPVLAIAAFFLGGEALVEAGALAWVVGLAGNAVVAGVWSLAFAWALCWPFVPRTTSAAVLGGLGLGLLAWFVDTYLLLPPLMGVLHQDDFWWRSVPPSWSFLAHLAFGAATGWWFKALEREAGGVAARSASPGRRR